MRTRRLPQRPIHTTATAAASLPSRPHPNPANTKPDPIAAPAAAHPSLHPHLQPQTLPYLPLPSLLLASSQFFRRSFTSHIHMTPWLLPRPLPLTAKGSFVVPLPPSLFPFSPSPARRLLREQDLHSQGAPPAPLENGALTSHLAFYVLIQSLPSVVRDNASTAPLPPLFLAASVPSSLATPLPPSPPLPRGQRRRKRTPSAVW